MVLIPPGAFTMGSPSDEPGRWGPTESPHQVTLTKAIYVGIHEVTQSEWEYACRAGSTAAFCNGTITDTPCVPLDPNLDQVGWYCGNAAGGTHEVGGKAPNAWGLQDVHGNAWEWCWDKGGES